MKLKYLISRYKHICNNAYIYIYIYMLIYTIYVFIYTHTYIYSLVSWVGERMLKEKYEIYQFFF